MHRAAAHVVGATVEAFRQVGSGESLHSASICGGLHHAMPDRASGFCIYNDVAVGIRSLLASGVERVAYVDVDVHHGDGVERIFYDDPRVLTISLHETGQALFPGTGFPAGLRRARAPRARRSTSRCRRARRTPAGCAPSTPSCRRCVREFAPDVLVTQHGCDSHREDPLADLMLSVDGQRASYLALHELAHEVARWAVGGHRRRRVRPGRGRAARLDATCWRWSAGEPLDPATDDPGVVAGPRPRDASAGPRRRLMTDGRDPAYRDWSEGYDPATWLDRSILATREEIFPRHGLDPLP